MKKRILSLVLTGVLCLSTAAPALAAGLDNFGKVNTYTAGQFTDVPADAWFAPNVQAAYELDLMTGSSATTFNPNGNLTIAEALVLACRLHSTYVGDGETFAVDGGTWYQPYVDYAVKNGIIAANAYTDYTVTATRAQFAAILAAALPDEALPAINSVTKLPDLDANAAYAAPVLKLYNAGILTGSDAAGSFKPTSTIQRSEVATIVTRMADKGLRKTFTLTAAPAQPAEDGAITLEDLQGTWSFLTYASDGKVVSGREVVISGDQITDTVHFMNYYEQTTATITEIQPNYTSNSHTFQAALLWDGATVKGDGSTGKKFKTEAESSVLTVDELGSTYLVVEKASNVRLEKASSAVLTQEFQTAANAAGVIAIPDQPVMEFLADYAVENGKQETFGDYEGQYECYLDLTHTLGTWNYSMYYDPDSGDITLYGSIFTSYGNKYTSTSTAKCALVLPRDLSAPYAVTYSSSGTATDPLGHLVLEPSSGMATAHVDPTVFSKTTESIIFETNEGDSFDADNPYGDLEASAQENCATTVRIALQALSRDILEPNGYTLKDLGFTNF